MRTTKQRNNFPKKKTFFAENFSKFPKIENFYFNTKAKYSDLQIFFFSKQAIPFILQKRKVFHFLRFPAKKSICYKRKTETNKTERTTCKSTYIKGRHEIKNGRRKTTNDG